MKLKTFGTKQKTEAAVMLLEGVPPCDVAAKFGVHVSTIYALRKDRGHDGTRPDRASHVVNLRLSDEELAVLNAFVADGGFPTRAAALRSLIRAAIGFLELRREEFETLGEARGELRAQGRNLNQLAFALNKSALKGGAKLTEQDRAFLADVRRSYVALERMLSGAFREVRQKGRAALHSGART